ncbi:MULTISPECIES: LCP family protein [Kitasatospora]|uniref:Putative lytR family regulatory protein n=1 Tax=Kitasatospora setae (strain ATCC 33774 / DSM 43861 / JCM 3304 / KCC A-0304 / NBRC 14216 / KM-6054) TaxID=452652 RepID=E4NEU8_KITSK|nr:MULTISPECIES: LCP family protein [Kitasatospora]BAJ29884.1 putative lytR family regulatory protein [Kitasatospora setae KM-6054]
MTGQRAGSSGEAAGWWEDHSQQDDSYRQDAPPRDDAPAPNLPRRRSGGHDAAPAPATAPATGGRAEARRAAQGRGGAGGRGGGNGSGSGGNSGGGSGGGGRAEARRAAQGRRKPRRTKRIVIWALVGTSLAVVGTGGFLYWKLNSNLSSWDSAGVSESRPPEAQADADGNKPMNILLIGSDSRDGANKDLGGGDEGGARSDTTILLHVYADHKHAVGISFPRDALVEIPACMLPTKKWTKPQPSAMFNSAFSVGDTDAGNPACTQNTVEKLTNLRVDHTIVVNFQGFADMTKAVGGVEVCLPNDIYERDLNPNLPRKGKVVYQKGVQKVEGQSALDYVRLRHGIGDGSDVGRMKRQQAFLSALIKQVKSNGMSPTALYPLADAATRSMTVDEGLNSIQKLTDLAMTLKGIDLSNIKFLTTPWHYQGERIGLNHPEVDQLWAALRADRTLDGKDASAGSASPTPTPAADPAPAATPAATPAAPVNGAGVKVAVLNGTTTGGLGNKAAATLKGANYTVTTTGNAPSQNHATTVVQYGSAGQKANAQAVAALFPGATVEAGGGAGVTLVLGKDYAGTAGGGTTAASKDPGPVSSAVAEGARSADQDACSDLSYG